MSDMGVVKEVMTLAHGMKEMKSLQNVLDVQTSCFHTLEAFCEGPCEKNQEFLVKHGAINMSNIVLSSCLRKVDAKTSRIGWGRLMKSVLQLLKDLLEKRPDLSVHEEMVANLDFDLLAEGLCEIHDRLCAAAIRYAEQNHSFEQSLQPRIEQLLREQPRARRLEELGKLLVALTHQLSDSSELVNNKFETGLYGAPLSEVAQKLGLVSLHLV